MLKYIYKATEEDIKQAIELDMTVFEGDDAGDLQTCLEWLSINPDIYIMIKDKGRVIGYSNIVPLKQEIYDLFVAGKFKDYMLTKDHILPYEDNNTYNLLFMSIVLDEKYRDGKLIKNFTKKIKQRFKKFEKRGIFIENIIADTVTEDGFRFFSRTFGFDYVVDNEGGKILKGKF